ncbi:MAG: CHASE3 domain-containing protein, partial [Pseudolabrys sp.]
MELSLRCNVALNHSPCAILFPSHFHKYCMASFTETIVRTRQGILLGIGFFLLVLIGIGVFLLVNQATSDAQQVARTLSVQDQLSNVLVNLRRAEAGQHGYLFTNQRFYLDDYKGAQPQTNQLLAELDGLSQDNPGRQA